MWRWDDSDDAPELVDRLVHSARAARATDVHLQPVADGLHVAWRIDGVLQDIAVVTGEIALRLTTRCKVLAELLTYRTDVPQEGRIRSDSTASEQTPEIRVCTFPTVHGERVVLRLFAPPDRLQRIEDLGLPAHVATRIESSLHEPGGALLFTGPAGSGKTTTAYACLRRIAGAEPRRSIVTVEDPVESIVEHVAQSQLDEGAGFDYSRALKSLLRQDPEVILVGEIRDAEVAATVVAAALTGHLVLSTFHAGSAATALRRLLDMGIETYRLRSAIRLVVNQHLLRARCECPVEAGCDRCSGTGFRGRCVAAEMLEPTDAAVAATILVDGEPRGVEEAARSSGWRSRVDSAADLVATGRTTDAEVVRVLGLGSR